MTKRYDIIHRPDGFMYGIDKEEKPKKREWAYDTLVPKLFQVEEDHIYNKVSCSLWTHDLDYVVKVIFTNNPSLGLPLLPDIKPFDFFKYKDLLIKELMAEKVAVKQLRIIERIWDVATKAASAKKYTEEDIRKAVDLGLSISTMSDEPFTSKTFKKTKRISIDGFIQSLSLKPIAVEVEMKDTFKEINDGCNSIPIHKGWELKLIDNKVQVKQWIY